MRTVDEIFADISAHQIKGLMIHSQLADYYMFLGLEKYAECHEKQYKCESHSWRKMCEYYITHFDRLIAEKQIDNPDTIPADWFKYERKNVDAQTKRRAVERGLTMWEDWERETKDMYQKAFSELLTLGEGAAAMKVKKLMCDVDYELAEVSGYKLNKMAHNYDISMIVGEQA